MWFRSRSAIPRRGGGVRTCTPRERLSATPQREWSNRHARPNPPPNASSNRPTSRRPPRRQRPPPVERRPRMRVFRRGRGRRRRLALGVLGAPDGQEDQRDRDHAARRRTASARALARDRVAGARPARRSRRRQGDDAGDQGAHATSIIPPCLSRPGGSGAPSTRSIRARSRTPTATASATCRASPRKLDHLQALEVEGIWLSPDLHLADGRLRLRRLRLLRHRPGVRHARRPRRAGRRVPRARHQARPRLGPEPQLRPAPVVPRVRSSSRDNPKRDWYVWRDEPNDWMSVVQGRAARRGRSTRPRGSTTCTASCPSSPTSTGTTPRSRRRCTTCCASGWTAASTACGWTRSHKIAKDPLLRDHAGARAPPRRGLGVDPPAPARHPRGRSTNTTTG